LKKFLSFKKSYGLALCLLGIVLAVHLTQGALSADGKPIITVDKPPYDGQVVIPVNKSQFLKVRAPFAEVSVGNPEIADVVVLSGQNLYILGKKIGSTNLAIRDKDGHVMSIMDVAVTYDVDALKVKMYELAPGDVVEVRPAGESIVLSGQVASVDRLRQLVQVAEQYAPGKVSNMLTVGGSQQVLLKVRFAEVQRSVLKDLGFTNDLGITSGGNLFSIATGALNPQAFLSGTADIANGNFTLLSVIDVLEKKGLVRTLAEPNIIALSGDNAKFLAGGEFPIPVAQSNASGGSSVGVEFKQFGVGLSFTPTVVGKSAINLQLEAEVSALDDTFSVPAGGVTGPALKVRRASSTVELLDGQSFAIAGLIEDSFEDTVRAVPGLGSIPIIGALARSTDFKRHQTELVVIIEAHLVQPTTAMALSSPTDNALPPSEFNLFMMGDTEQGSVLNKAAGIDGPYGYILP
jgi:pilus assembly protein CpaC